MARSLSSGGRLPAHLSDARLGADGLRAVARLSPVSITGVTPSAFRSATACATSLLMVSATAQGHGPFAAGQQRDRAAGFLTLQRRASGQSNCPLFDPAVVSQPRGMAVDQPTPRPAEVLWPECSSAFSESADVTPSAMTARHWMIRPRCEWLWPAPGQGLVAVSAVHGLAGHQLGLAFGDGPGLVERGRP